METKINAQIAEAIINEMKDSIKLSETDVYIIKNIDQSILDNAIIWLKNNDDILWRVTGTDELLPYSKLIKLKLTGEPVYPNELEKLNSMFSEIMNLDEDVCYSKTNDLPFRYGTCYSVERIVNEFVYSTRYDRLSYECFEFNVKSDFYLKMLLHLKDLISYYDVLKLCSESECETSIDENNEEQTETIVSIPESNLENFDNKENNDENINDNTLIDLENLSKRTKDFLINNNISNIPELINFVKNNDLSSIRNFGQKSIDEIYNLIKKHDETIDVSTLYNEEEQVYSSHRISDIFTENKYAFFVKYCEENEIETIEDLSDFSFSSLNVLSGVGVTKIIDTKEKYTKVCNKLGIASSNDRAKLVFPNINDELLDSDVTLLKDFGANKPLLDAFKKLNIEKISDLESCTYDDLFFANNESLNCVNEIIPFLEKSLVELLLLKLDNIKNQDKYNYDFVLFRSEGYTLRNIGETDGITRQRIDQIVRAMLTSLCKYLTPIIDRKMKEKCYLFVNELDDITDNNDYKKIIEFWCKTNNEYYNYLNFADVILKKEIKISEIDKKLKQIAKDFIGDGINLSENIDDLSNLLENSGYEFLTIDSFLEFIFQNGYKQYGDFICYGNLPQYKMLEILITKYFPDGISKSDRDGIEKLFNYMKQEFDFEPDSQFTDREYKNLTKKIENYFVLRRKGTYTTKDCIKIEPQLLLEIKDYIDNCNDTNVYYQNVFNEFEPKLKLSSNVDCFYFLWGVLKYYFNNDYDFSNKLYLTKINEESNSGHLNEKMREKIINDNAPISRQDVNNMLSNVTDIFLYNILQFDKYLFLWDFQQYSSLDIIDLSEEEKEYLSSTIISFMNDNSGYCSANMLFNKVKTEKIDLLNKNNIKNSSNLFYLCEKLFEEKYIFKKPHIICKNGFSKTPDSKNIALYLLGNPDVLDYTELQKLAIKLEWLPSTMGLIFNDITDNYTRIDENKYIKPEKFSISPQQIQIIKDCLNEQFQNGYLSLMKIDFTSFPNIGYEWNVFLIKSIIEIYLSEYKIIEPQNKDRRYLKGVILNSISTINSFDEFVSLLIRTKGISSISENDMFELLNDNGLIIKKIPKELYESSKLSFDEDRKEFIIR